MIKDLSSDYHRIPCLQMELQPIVAYHLIRMIKPWKWSGSDPENQRIIQAATNASIPLLMRDEMPCHHEDVTRSGSPGLDH